MGGTKLSYYKSIMLLQLTLVQFGSVDSQKLLQLSERLRHIASLCRSIFVQSNCMELKLAVIIL